jgi:hypothetical protein
MKTKQKRKLQLSKKIVITLTNANTAQIIGGIKTSAYPTCQTGLYPTCRVANK